MSFPLPVNQCLLNNTGMALFMVTDPWPQDHRSLLVSFDVVLQSLDEPVILQTDLELSQEEESVKCMSVMVGHHQGKPCLPLGLYLCHCLFVSSCLYVCPCLSITISLSLREGLMSLSQSPG